jgi:hypothetical protein
VSRRLADGRLPDDDLNIVTVNVGDKASEMIISHSGVTAPQGIGLVSNHNPRTQFTGSNGGTQAGWASSDTENVCFHYLGLKLISTHYFPLLSK